MHSTRPRLPSLFLLPDNERTPFTDALLELIQWQTDRIADLEDEIQSLKQQTKKPRFKASKMDQETEVEDNEADADANEKASKRRTRRKKKSTLTVHDETIIQPDIIPEGSRFKGYREVIVQDLMIMPHTLRYRLAQYETPDGSYVTGQLPIGIRGGHWGSTLHRYIFTNL